MSLVAITSFFFGSGETIIAAFFAVASAPTFMLLRERVGPCPGSIQSAARWWACSHHDNGGRNFSASGVCP